MSVALTLLGAKTALELVLRLYVAKTERSTALMKIAADPATEPEMKAEALVALKADNEEAARVRKMLDFLKFWDND